MQRAACRNQGHWEVHVAASALVQWTIVGIVIALIYKPAMAASREGFEQDSEYLRKSKRKIHPAPVLRHPSFFFSGGFHHSR
jgi:hypothetical protein